MDSKKNEEETYREISFPWFLCVSYKQTMQKKTVSSHILMTLSGCFFKYIVAMIQLAKCWEVFVVPRRSSEGIIRLPVLWKLVFRNHRRIIFGAICFPSPKIFVQFDLIILHKQKVINRAEQKQDLHSENLLKEQAIMEETSELCLWSIVKEKVEYLNW